MYGLYEKFKDKLYIIDVFETKEKADEERIYQQVEYNNPLIVKRIGRK